MHYKHIQATPLVWDDCSLQARNTKRPESTPMLHNIKPHGHAQGRGGGHSETQIGAALGAGRGVINGDSG